MSRRFVVAAVLAAGLLAIPGGAPGRAQNPGGDAPRKPVGVTPDPALLKIVSVLHDQKVSFEGDLNSTPLVEILANLGKRHEINFVIATEEFRNEPNPNIADAKPRLFATRLDGLSVYRFLTTVLGSMGAVLMVRNDHIEILPRDAAMREAGLAVPPRSDETGPPTGAI